MSATASARAGMRWRSCIDIVIRSPGAGIIPLRRASRRCDAARQRGRFSSAPEMRMTRAESDCQVGVRSASAEGAEAGQDGGIGAQAQVPAGLVAMLAEDPAGGVDLAQQALLDVGQEQLLLDHVAFEKGDEAL